MREKRRNSSGKKIILDPRAKMVILICLSGPAVFTDDIFCMAALLVISVICSAVMGADVSGAAPFLKATAVMLIPLFIVQCIFVRDGNPVLSVCGFSLVMSGGIAAGVLMVLRILTVVTSAMILSTSPSRDYLLALVRCRMPYELAFMIMTAMHFLPLLSAEAADMVSAVQMKGIDLKNISVRRKLKVYLSLMLPLLSRTLERAEAMSCAMQMRGFRSRPQRTYMRSLKLMRRDCLVIVICPAAAVLFLMAEKNIF